MSEARCTSSKRQWSRRSCRQVASIGGTDSGATSRTVRTSPEARIASWTGTWLGAPVGTAHERRSGARASTAARSRASSMSWRGACGGGGGALRTMGLRPGDVAARVGEAAGATGAGAIGSAGHRNHNRNAAASTAAATTAPRRESRRRRGCAGLGARGRAIPGCAAARPRGIRARPRTCRSARCVIAAPAAAVTTSWQTTRVARFQASRAPGIDPRASPALAARRSARSTADRSREASMVRARR